MLNSIASYIPVIEFYQYRKWDSNLLRIITWIPPFKPSGIKTGSLSTSKILPRISSMDSISPSKTNILLNVLIVTRFFFKLKSSIICTTQTISKESNRTTLSIHFIMSHQFPNNSVPPHTKQEYTSNISQWGSQIFQIYPLRRACTCSIAW